MEPMYLSIQQKETGKQIKRLLDEKGFSVRDVQSVMGFENPQAVYKWISGKSLPSLDNILILSRMLNTSIENILVVDGDFVFYVTESSMNCLLYPKILSFSYAYSSVKRNPLALILNLQLNDFENKKVYSRFS